MVGVWGLIFLGIGKCNFLFTSCSFSLVWPVNDYISSLPGYYPLVLCPDPTQLTGGEGGLVSKVQILGLAPEAWSGQSDHGSENKYSISPKCYDIHFSHWQICNPTLTITRLLYFHKTKDFDSRSLLLTWARWSLDMRLDILQSSLESRPPGNENIRLSWWLLLSTSSSLACIVTGLVLEIVRHATSEDIIRGFIFFFVAAIVLIPGGKFTPFTRGFVPRLISSSMKRAWLGYEAIAPI